ncbi:arginine deiminase-related protein [Rubrivirga sp. S365]|uniref:Arginine deiminase-related protein n=1 Tax=Rubrivirga litoralis TaxID=3075598 RepID=A0ABU3BML5_9BACT|nr:MULTISPECIES: arginine deiminase-related protein [unclassified Rubrivirga]MDT0630470.1 arginine deiminase-related protein [Rubrivirga sp. F394]MDT7857552.1 arginine deiminase-related protein [Rubrivirga sp. S365]
MSDAAPSFEVSALPAIPRPGRVLLTTPDHFEVAYVINPHMAGNVGDVDRDRARHQWERLRDAYVRLGLDVSVLDGAAGLPDMVFCANQTLPYQTPGGERGAIISRMHAAQRKPEVEHYRRFFEGEGYEVRGLDPDLPGDFEGMGDALWHPGRYLLWGGYGYRTDRQVYDRLERALGFMVVPLKLDDPDFYHLDTCLCPLDEQTALLYPGAFDDEGIEALRAHFDRVIEAPEDEARGLFACNAHCPDGTHVLVQQGCTETTRLLQDAGYEVVELQTDEFLKSGGSVFCMKLMFW